MAAIEVDSGGAVRFTASFTDFDGATDDPATLQYKVVYAKSRTLFDAGELVAVGTGSTTWTLFDVFVNPSTTSPLDLVLLALGTFSGGDTKTLEHAVRVRPAQW
jgi:hypothetical protein